MKRLTTHEIIAGQVHDIPIFEMQDCAGVEEIINRLAAIEDILGDKYDLDCLRELAEADREGRCVVLPIKIPGRGWYCNDKFPNAISAYFDYPSQVVECMEDYILRGTKEEAEAALAKIAD